MRLLVNVLCGDNDVPRVYFGSATLQCGLFTAVQVIFLLPFREPVYRNETLMQLEINSSGIQSLESTLGMFPCQLLLGYQHFLSNCMAAGYICAFNADRCCRAQLLMEHSYPFSHYCLLYVRFTRPVGKPSGTLCVCLCRVWPIGRAWSTW